MNRQSTACYYSGLDLGQSHQHTALAVLEKRYVADADEFAPDVRQYAVRHLERFSPGTPYGEIFARVRDLFAADPLAGSSLIVDQTGVGAPVVELLEARGVDAEIGRVTITDGQHASYDRGWMVPKKELVGLMQVLLQGRRLRVSEELEEAQTLVRELTSFQAKVTVATAEMNLAWREGAHDDLVLAVAVAAWEGEKHRPLTDADMPMTLGGRVSWHQRWA